MNFREYIPTYIKLLFRILVIHLRDIADGNLFRLVHVNGNKSNLPIQYCITQQIMPNEYLDNKIENLNIAIDKINSLIIEPGKIFSFNKIVGNPSSKNGFKESRSIKNGIVVPEIGGGLCQLPWIMYHLCLQTGIKIIERHHHSRDIYDETTRFAPLGSDATIVYGYKDFRIKNNTDANINFVFTIKNNLLNCSICSNKKITINNVFFNFDKLKENKLLVRTYINAKLFREDYYETI